MGSTASAPQPDGAAASALRETLDEVLPEVAKHASCQPCSQYRSRLEGVQALRECRARGLQHILSPHPVASCRRRAGAAAQSKPFTSALRMGKISAPPCA